MSLTESQRRVLTAAGVQITEGPDASLALSSIPIRVIDHPTDPDVVYVVNTAAIDVSPPGGLERRGDGRPQGSPGPALAVPAPVRLGAHAPAGTACLGAA